jgi:hypothetical protein
MQGTRAYGVRIFRRKGTAWQRLLTHDYMNQQQEVASESRTVNGIDKGVLRTIWDLVDGRYSVLKTTSEVKVVALVARLLWNQPQYLWKAAQRDSVASPVIVYWHICHHHHHHKSQQQTQGLVPRLAFTEKHVIRSRDQEAKIRPHLRSTGRRIISTKDSIRPSNFPQFPSRCFCYFQNRFIRFV